MNTLLLSIHILVCLALIGIVLIQGGKGAEAGASFGGGGSNTKGKRRGYYDAEQAGEADGAISPSFARSSPSY